MIVAVAVITTSARRAQAVLAQQVDARRLASDLEVQRDTHGWSHALSAT
jgi:hypothetical protein